MHDQPLETVEVPEASPGLLALARRLMRTSRRVMVTSAGEVAARLLNEKLTLAPWAFNRDELYDR
jgi:hypothetical protein